MDTLINAQSQGKSCVFFGSGEAVDNELVNESKVKSIIRSLITDFGVTEFISGGNKGSGKQFEDVIIELKREFSNIRLAFLSIYEHNTTKHLSKIHGRYDEILYPPEMKISRKSNTHATVSYWAVEQSDFTFVHSEQNYGIPHLVGNKFPTKCLFNFGKPPISWKNHMVKKLNKLN